MTSPRPTLRGCRAPNRPRGPALRAALATLALAACALAGCGAFGKKDDQNMSPEALYDRAAKLINDGSYEPGIKTLEALTARYPFSDSARQARLDLIYAYYKAHEKESAIDAADTFIRENPTHARIDYAYYMKGLVYFERAPNFLERWFNVDLSERPPQDARKSFDAFLRVVTQYPNSEYSADARQRMVYLRNRLAEYELHVADYYLRRGAFVAALDRSRYVIETYDGAPATRHALELMVRCYHELDMPELAADSQKVLAANFPASAEQHAKKKHWWQFSS
ncbi:MAG TPA: outer membrane protein assembly factor BamD [Steroidobacteraceae bacterium]|nr:outer membrane protein assembly factor BamD [Steroidobacteraceae bacterium]